METNDVLIRLITIGRTIVFISLGILGYSIFEWGETVRPEWSMGIMKYIVLVFMVVVGIVWFCLERKILWKKHLH